MKFIQSLIFVCLLFAYGHVAAQNFSIMTYNVRNGSGMDGVRNLDRTAEVIKSAKVRFVALQELDSMTVRSSKTDILAQLAELTQMNGTYARAIAYDGGAYGIGLLSDRKPTKVHRIALPGSEEARVLLIAEFGDCVLFCTHFSLTAKDRLSSIEQIIALAARYKKPLFLLGDLNCEPSSAEFSRISQFFTLLSDKTVATYPADNPTDVIDYVWGTGGYKYKSVKSEVLDAPWQSDHRPIVVNFVCTKK